MSHQTLGQHYFLTQVFPEITTTLSPIKARAYNDNDAMAAPGRLAEDCGGQLEKRARMGNDSPPQPSSRKKRALTACEVCRARKTKCSNDRPKCRYCTESGSECVYMSQQDDQQ